MKINMCLNLQMICIGILVLNGFFSSTLSLEYSRQLLKFVSQHEDHLISNPMLVFTGIAFLSDMSISVTVALGCLICWIPLQYLGRRSTLELLSAPFLILGSSLTFTFHHVMEQNHEERLTNYADVILFLGICLQGLSCGFLFVASPIYILETIGKVACTSTSIGILLLCTQMSTTCGLLVANIFPLTNKTYFFHLIPAAFSILSLVGFYFLAESPRWLLLKKNRFDDAEQALKALTLKSEDNDIPSYLQQLIKDYRAFKENQNVTSYLHPLLLVIGICSIWYLYGVHMYDFYASWTIKYAGISIKWKLDPIILGLCIRFSSLSILTAMYVIVKDITFHTTFLTFASGIVTLSLTVTGFCFYGFEEETAWVLYFCWLPLSSYFLFQIAFWLGPGSQVTIIAVVVLPQAFRPSIFSIAGAIFWLGDIFSTRLVIPMISTLHPFGTFWFFAGMSAINLIFLLCSVFPELYSEVRSKPINVVSKDDNIINEINCMYASSQKLNVPSF